MLSAQREIACSRGATMVEFALVSILFFGLIGVLLDLGYVLYQYSTLSHITQLASRRIAATSAPVSSDIIRGATSTELTNILSKYGVAINNSVQYCLSVEPLLVNGNADRRNCNLQLRGERSVSCFFCLFTPAQRGTGFRLSITSTQPIEDDAECSTLVTELNRPIEIFAEGPRC